MIKPINKRVLLRVNENSTKEVAGLIVQKRDPVVIAEVLSSAVEDIQVGQNVVLLAGRGTTCEYGLLVDASDILAILE